MLTFSEQLTIGSSPVFTCLEDQFDAFMNKQDFIFLMSFFNSKIKDLHFHKSIDGFSCSYISSCFLMSKILLKELRGNKAQFEPSNIMEMNY